MKTLILSAIIVTASVNALAWGDREQGALLGYIIGRSVAQEQYRQPPPTLYPQQQVYQQPPAVYFVPPVYVQPRTQTCLQHPRYDYQGRLLGYEISCH